jgi:hypothetical protein
MGLFGEGRPVAAVGHRRDAIWVIAVGLAYLALTLGVTWPLLPNFTTALTGVGDTRHHLWMLWHTKEALAGREQLFHTSLLYYPHGTTLLTSAIGPFSGLLALPFWRLGPEAAYNGALVVGFWASACCMYALARGLGFGRDVAFFAGILFVMAPIHLAGGMYGHLSKVFAGGMPLFLLGLHRSLGSTRTRWWVIFTALAVLITMLQSPEQAVYCAFAMGFFGAAALVMARRGQRLAVIGRCALVAIAIVILTGPLVKRLHHASLDPAAPGDRALESTLYQPDLVQFFVPPLFGRFLGDRFADLQSPFIKAQHETAVFVSWTGLALCLLALLSSKREARLWLAFTAVCALFALGPYLVVWGESRFTRYSLPIALPYAVLASLPGTNAVRSPGRFMLLGAAGVAATASFGLTWLIAKAPSWTRGSIVLGATALVLVEFWTVPWPQETLRPVPAFYRSIANDPGTYGVFDLPIRPLRPLEYPSLYDTYSSLYQVDQMTHRKAIASGYIDRAFLIHPVFPYLVSDSVDDAQESTDLLVDGKPTNRYANSQYMLARKGYRYVVFHKPEVNNHRPDSWGYEPGAWGETAARAFLKGAFREQRPLVDDEQVTVYEVDPSLDPKNLEASIALRESSEQAALELQTGKHWAILPASFKIASPSDQPARLEITPDAIYDPTSNTSPADATVRLKPENGPPVPGLLRAGQSTVFPLQLSAGTQVVMLRLAPSPTDGSRLPNGTRFSIRSINLVTQGASAGERQ